MRTASIVLAALLLWGCKDPETAQAEAKSRKVGELLSQARAAMADERPEQAVTLLKQATSVAPSDAAAWLLLAEAQKRAGNDGAALMALKTAEDVGARGDPAVKRERAELYRRMGQAKQAIAALLELRDANQLTDAELLLLAHLQAREGEVDAAWTSLEKVQSRKPDDPDAKVVEAEILLLKGEEVLAGKLMDRLVTDHPTLTSARVLRARYFLANGLAEAAEQDLSLVGEEGAKKPEVVTLRSRALNQLKRYDDAVAILQPLVDSNPTEPDLLAQLAETRLLLGQSEQAQELVDQALAVRPRFARGLYVRGRALELQGDLKGAAENYGYALRSDPGFAPALSRTWRIYEHKGEKAEAMSALERLLFMGEASVDEKFALVELYLDTGNNLDRARKMVDEALKVDPESVKARNLKARLQKAGGGPPKKPGIIILKGR